MTVGAENLCDVCRMCEPVGVYASGFGPISLAYCSECLDRGAEAEFIFHHLYENVAGEDVNNLRPEVANVVTFADGEYVTFADWVAKRNGLAT